MTYAISAALVGDLNNPNPDALRWALTQHQNEIERLEKLDKYYRGEHKKTPEGKDKTVINHAKYIADLNVGFTVGIPVSYSAEKDVQGLDIVTDKFRDMDIVTHDSELEKSLSVFGRAYELHYLKKIDNVTTAPMVKQLDPRNAFVVVDDTVDETPLFGVYYFKMQTLNGISGNYKVFVYTSTDVLEYETTAPSLIGDTPVITPHRYGMVPLVEFINNQEEQGDFEQVLGSIDDYNTLQTDRVQDKEKFVRAILAVYGTYLTGDDGEPLTEIPELIQLPAKGDGAAIEYIVNSFDETQVQVLVDSTANDIHKISFTPNLNDEKFAGNVSGEAMKYKLFGLLQLLATKQRYLQRGIKQRLRLLENILQIQNYQVKNLARAKIIFKPNLPANLTEIIQNIAASQGFVPLAISLGWLPDVDSPAEVIKMLDAEKAKNADAQQKMLGGQVQDVNTDSEVTADDEAGPTTD